MSSWRIELLHRHHHRDRFSCGEESLDAFLRMHAGQNARKDISRTYVAVPERSDIVCGYYTLSTGSAAFCDLPDDAARKLPKYPVPTAHLARLAVDVTMQGQGLGGILLIDALKRVLRLADQIGIHAITVQALTDRARKFYAGHGFLPLRDDPLHLYIPMATIRAL